MRYYFYCIKLGKIYLWYFLLFGFVALKNIFLFSQFCVKKFIVAIAYIMVYFKREKIE